MSKCVAFQMIEKNVAMIASAIQMSVSGGRLIEPAALMLDLRVPGIISLISDLFGTEQAAACQHELTKKELAEREVPFVIYTVERTLVEALRPKGCEPLDCHDGVVPVLAIAKEPNSVSCVYTLFDEPHDLQFTPSSEGLLN